MIILIMMFVSVVFPMALFVVDDIVTKFNDKRSDTSVSDMIVAERRAQKFKNFA